MCGDPDRQWFANRDICYPTMQRARAEATYDALHKNRPFHDGTFTIWNAERSAETPFHYRAGVTIYVGETDMDPDDHFLSAPKPATGETPHV